MRLGLDSKRGWVLLHECQTHAPYQIHLVLRTRFDVKVGGQRAGRIVKNEGRVWQRDTHTAAAIVLA